VAGGERIILVFIYYVQSEPLERRLIVRQLMPYGRDSAIGIFRKCHRDVIEWRTDGDAHKFYPEGENGKDITIDD
jgi:hypothetical protein